MSTPEEHDSPLAVKELPTPESRKRLWGILGSIGIIAIGVTLVLTLVVIPQQRRAEEEYNNAVEQYSLAKQACTQATEKLSSAIAHGNALTKTVPQDVLDPSILSGSAFEELSKSLQAAETILSCECALMAETTEEILRQVKESTELIPAIEDVTDTLLASSSPIDDAIQAKKDAEAVEKRMKEEVARKKAEAEEEVRRARLTLSETKEYGGYSLRSTIQLTDWVKLSDSVAATAAWQFVGGSGAWTIPSNRTLFQATGSTFDEKKSAVMFGKLTVTNTTPQFALDHWFAVNNSPVLRFVWPKGRYNQVMCSVWSGKQECSYPGNWGNGSTKVPNWGGLASGDSTTLIFFVVDGDAFSPADPQGEEICTKVYLGHPDNTAELKRTW